MAVSTPLHWIDGPWPGRLAMSPRPRGGDWLDDEVAHWKRANVDSVFSLLTPEEESDLNLEGEKAVVQSQGLRFLQFPIPDRQVPDSEIAFSQALASLEAELGSGRNVVLHCRQGVGRTGLMAACLLVAKGIAPDTAIRQLSETRGVAVPETPEQLQWIERHALALHHE